MAGTVQRLLDAGLRPHCLRDLTRGGLASALNEIAEGANRALHIEERNVSAPEEVRGACEMLGLDPLYVANEGRFVAFFSEEEADRALEILKRAPAGEEASRIGRVEEAGSPMVTLTSSVGTRRILDRLTGEQLPRIC